MSTDIELIRPDTLRSQVENTIRDAIMAGRFRPGARLIERDLCERLGVSRTSVREALRKLEAEKLVTIIPHKGPMVATISADEVQDLYALRGLLESFAAREFARVASDEAIAEFGAAAKELRAQATAGSRDGVLKAKSRLYDVLLSNCGNALISEMLNSLYSRINLLRATSLMAPDRLSISLKEIDRLYKALKARDADAAEAAAKLHVSNAQAAVMKVLAAMEQLSDED
ncbi:GntR family transcriptional regulator [Paraburkholderia fungorum]|jgi:DNA-binding GntR family transcriptional regulator|uniref:GntR family transcriptional regulator n=1 Tax=Paraburkholderia fungorum TaxID=134537 RepID=UPI000D052D90|nr:GntR family transcriptional regulator [Paraburkholderia fungorum]PRZ44966.1 GntR family transcriptional regulator [Paraburkholderia fungorum]